jgi:hypothetical protein
MRPVEGAHRRLIAELNLKEVALPEDRGQPGAFGVKARGGGPLVECHHPLKVGARGPEPARKPDSVDGDGRLCRRGRKGPSVKDQGVAIDPDVIEAPDRVRLLAQELPTKVWIHFEGFSAVRENCDQKQSNKAKPIHGVGLR